jgi:hypothetical protein
MNLAQIDFRFWTFVEFSRPLKLDLSPDTCFVALESRYQQQSTKLLLFFGSRLTTIVSKKSTLSFDSFSFHSSSTVLAIGSTSITSSFPLI